MCCTDIVELFDMPRKYTTKLGSRSYGSSYTVEALTKAVRQVKSGRMSLRKAIRSYKIPHGTLFNKVHGIHNRRTGGQHRLSPEAENRLLATIDLLCTWKVPLTGLDIRLLVKDYLDRAGVHDSRFCNSCPGEDRLKSFICRHKLTQRLADNVKTARAEIDATGISEYFDELEQTVAGIPPTNIYNYDETNVTDDPGSTAIVCRRGLKRVERKERLITRKVASV